MGELVSTRLGTVEYVVLGDGPPCLLLHGGHGSCEDTFGSEEIRSAGLSAVIPSRPGYGRTPASAGPSAHEAADLMAALLDDLSIDSAAVLAVSAGGPTALHLAARHPHRVRGLVLECAGHGPLAGSFIAPLLGCASRVPARC